MENALGILASRWRIFYHKINLDPQNVQIVVVVACIHHNFPLVQSKIQKLLDEDEKLGRHQAHDTSKKHLNSPEGTVSWQDRMVS